MRVLEIFYSIDGEGKRAGELTTFIRLAGCNLRCVWCDTAYSHDCNAGQEMCIDAIIKEVEKYGCKNITVTGGEPLIHKDIDILLQKLSKLGYDINIETNGSISIEKYLNAKYKNVWFTMDYKTTSSGMNSKMKQKHYMQLRKQDVLKMVVGSNKDLNEAYKVIKECSQNKNLFYLSPVFGMIEPVQIVEFMKKKQLYNVRIQLQLHKIIWDKDKRCV